MPFVLVQKEQKPAGLASEHIRVILFRYLYLMGFAWIEAHHSLRGRHSPGAELPKEELSTTIVHIVRVFQPQVSLLRTKQDVLDVSSAETLQLFRKLLSVRRLRGTNRACIKPDIQPM